MFAMHTCDEMTSLMRKDISMFEAKEKKLLKRITRITHLQEDTSVDNLLGVNFELFSAMIKIVD